VVAQDTFLLYASVLENISYGLRNVPRDKILEAARMAYVDEFIPTMPDGYDTILGERGFRLSGGQKQRIAIARAIFRSPGFLILDEATSSLDWMADQWVQEALKKLMEGRTTLIITHRLNMVQDVEKIFVIEGGRIVEKGVHGELMKRNGLYAALQAGGDMEVPLPGDEAGMREFITKMRMKYIEEAQSGS
jgi:ABC-type multidrug transport system fused ATPase/permease subunit